MHAACHAAALCVGLLMLSLGDLPAAAQGGWSPFRQNAEPSRPPAAHEAAAPKAEPPWVRQGSDPASAQAPLRQTAPRKGSVERSELSPVMSRDGSALPFELWRGLDLKSIEELLAQLELPPRSPALHRLWRRALLASAAPPAGLSSPDHFLALRLEALYRSGLLRDMEELLAGSGASTPLIRVLQARLDIGLGRKEAGCRMIAELGAPGSGIPDRLKGEMQLLSGYCAAAAGDVRAAGLAAELAREEGIVAELPLAVLTGIALDNKPHLPLPQRVPLLDYRFLELMGPIDAAQAIDKAEPALLTVIAADAEAPASVQIAAAEAAMWLNALSADAVAEVYRRQSLSSAAVADPTAHATDPLLRRALFFQAIELSRSPAQEARFVRAVLEDARKSGFGAQMAQVLAPVLVRLPPTLELELFAETAAEIALAAGDHAGARRWIEATGGPRPWLALCDLVNPWRREGRLPGLAPIEDLAQRGALGADVLHRLATLLNALDIEVPIPLWDAASRKPQPSGGHLPDTGVLADLAQAAKRKDVGRVILLVMRTLGPDGPEGANILALGDSVRALKVAGLEADARGVALEALVAVWPRQAAN
jgi:hypothetical protein